MTCRDTIMPRFICSRSAVPGFLNPRLSDMAEAVSRDYEGAEEFIKLFLPAGEIDIVVGTSLTDRPFDIMHHYGREIRIETWAEIIAKKMWHRGDRAKARGLYDLCAVAAAEPEAIDAIGPHLQFESCMRLAQRIVEPARARTV